MIDKITLIHLQLILLKHPEVANNSASHRSCLQIDFGTSTTVKGNDMTSLFKDAMAPTLQAADIAGIRAFAVYAKV